MDQSIRDIIKQSTFELQDGTFVYAKVKSLPDAKNHFLVSKDKDEITVVTLEENLNNLDLIERNKEDYKLIALNISVPFYAVGFLASVSNAIAKRGINLLIVSTYSKDYILIKKEKLEDARQALVELGFQKK